MPKAFDQQTFFSAERSALSWNRTAITLMAFGFTIERFGMFMHVVGGSPDKLKETTTMSFWVGFAFILLGVAFSVIAAAQYRQVLKTMPRGQLPAGYNPRAAQFINVIVALLGVVMACFLLGTILKETGIL
ncbi:MAG TPA: DUF202 domain-containing protein [Patescibacteria group bacterium]|nr:DUF202 domain-containing protein [Patescibacteria group bacterium]